MKNKKKAEILGIPYGTAAGRLRKEILFHLVQRLDLDSCFRCGRKIATSKDLSIDHKIDWLNSKNPKDLFFDIENISFSHLRCNSGAASTPRKKYFTDEDRKMARNLWLRTYRSNLPKAERQKKRRIKYLKNGY